MFTSTAVHKQLTDAGFVFEDKTGRYFFKAEPVWTKQDHAVSGKRQGAFPCETIAEYRAQTEVWLESLRLAAKATKATAPPAVQPEAEAEVDEEAERKRAKKEKKRREAEAAEAEAEAEAEANEEEEEEEKPKKEKKEKKEKKRKTDEAEIEEEIQEKKKKKKSKDE